jgi:hypothetical protein
VWHGSASDGSAERQFIYSTAAHSSPRVAVGPGFRAKAGDVNQTVQADWRFWGLRLMRYA